MQNTLFVNGKICTGPNQSHEAEAIAVEDGIITDIGSSAELIRKHKSFHVMDLQNRRTLPSFIDSHIHFLAYCMKQEHLDLDGLSLEQCIHCVQSKARTARPGEWILGQGWNKNIWSHSQFPDRFMLDSVSPDHPVCLESRDYHSTWINSKALSFVIDKIPSINNEFITKDERGNSTGVFFEDARQIIWDVIPEPSGDQKKAVLKNGLRLAYQNGLSGIHTFETLNHFFLYQELEKEGLPLRITCFLPAADLQKIIDLKIHENVNSDWLKFGGIKFFVDGALGSQTALLYQPYHNSDHNYGARCIDEKELAEQVKLANDYDIPCAIHAIGDKANSIALAAINQSGKKSIRNRIEHAQLISDNDFSSFHHLVASMQPIHIREDIAPANLYWGKRTKNAFAFRTLLNHNAVIAFGSDAPVETPNVFEGIFSALKRTPRNCDISWHTEQSLSRKEIIHAYTLGSAYASSTEKQLGSIEIGKKADFMSLSDDLLFCNEELIPKIKVIMMVIDGIIVHNTNEN